jgi:hypothetical protein
LLAACGSDGPPISTGDDVVRERVALVPVIERHDVDLLFVIDDSPSTLDEQTTLKNAFPTLLAELARDGALPNLHIGVITSDIGTLGADDSAPGPSIGSGPGSCSGIGKNGALVTNNTALVMGAFISDVAASDGARDVNYTGTLADAFSAIASVGSSGCGFEQPLEAMRRALDNHPSNAGFLRPDAALAVIAMQDEDDCSFTHSTLLSADTSTFGPLQSFRCTRFGVTCWDGGATPDEMNTIGTKARCHSNEASEYLTPIARYESFLASIKADVRDVLFAMIAGEPVAGGLEVEQRTPPGGGTPIPALAHACTWNGTNGPVVADPAVRMADMTRALPRGTFETLCTADDRPALLDIAHEIRGMLGDSCLVRDIALPADCQVVDETLTGGHAILPCSASATSDCYELVEDPACTTSQHLRIRVTRSAPAAPDTMVNVRCRLPS